MRTFTVEWQAEWSPRKIPMMRMDVSDFIRQQGGKHVLFSVKATDPDEEEPKPRPMLDLACTECEKSGNGKPAGYWASQFFVPCPTCGRRETVRKRSRAEVKEFEAAQAAEIDAAALEAALPIEEPEPEPAPPKRTKAKPGRKHKKHSWTKEGICRVCQRRKPGRRAAAAT